jgi:hypothetical protein
MIEAKLGRTEKSKVNYKEIEGLINDDANFKPIYSLYRTAASVNPRFSREPLKANQKWLLLLKLILFKNAAIANN